MAGELGVGDDINAGMPLMGGEVVEHVLDLGLPATGRTVSVGEGEGIQARGVASGEDDDFHCFLIRKIGMNEHAFQKINASKATKLILEKGEFADHVLLFKRLGAVTRASSGSAGNFRR